MLALQRSYAAQLRGDAAAAAALTREAMDQLGENELMLSSAVQGFLAMAEWLHGRLAAAAGSLRVQHRVVAPGGPGHHHGVGVLLPGPPAAGPGPPRCRRRDVRARPGSGRASRASRCGLRPGPRWSGWARSPTSADDLDRALEYVNRGITLCRQFVHTPPLAAGLVTLAWIRQASGDRRGARDAMAEAESFSAGPAGLLNPVPAQRARLLLAQGDVAGGGAVGR